MTGTLSATISRNAASGLFKIIVDWLCNASGAAVATFAELLINEASGFLLSVETIPGLNGDRTTTVPSANYDITVTDEYAFDVLEGTLTNRSASAAEKSIPLNPLALCQEDLSINIANAGDSKTGRIVLTLSRRA